MKKILFASAIALAAGIAPAMAADAIEEIPGPIEPEAIFSWTGGYIGIQGGYAWGESHAREDNGFFFSDIDPDGFFGGIYVGYNAQLGSNWVLGIDADVNISGVDGSDAVRNALGVPFDGISATGEQDWNAAIRARVGFAVDRFLPYIAGGVAFSDYNVTLKDGGDVLASRDDTYTGWTIGAGAEYAFTDNLIFRGEYRYTDFGSADFSWDAPNDTEIDLKTHDVRVGIAYKF